MTSRFIILYSLLLRWALFSFCFGHSPARIHLKFVHNSDLFHFLDGKSWNPLIFSLHPSLCFPFIFIETLAHAQATFSTTLDCASLLLQHSELVSHFNSVPPLIPSYLSSPASLSILAGPLENTCEDFLPVLLSSNLLCSNSHVHTMCLSLLKFGVSQRQYIFFSFVVYFLLNFSKCMLSRHVTDHPATNNSTFSIEAICFVSVVELWDNYYCIYFKSLKTMIAEKLPLHLIDSL